MARNSRPFWAQRASARSQTSRGDALPKAGAQKPWFLEPLCRGTGFRNRSTERGTPRWRSHSRGARSPLPGGGGGGEAGAPVGARSGAVCVWGPHRQARRKKVWRSLGEQRETAEAQTVQHKTWLRPREKGVIRSAGQAPTPPGHAAGAFGTQRVLTPLLPSAWQAQGQGTFPFLLGVEHDKGPALRGTGVSPAPRPARDTPVLGKRGAGNGHPPVLAVC